MHTRKLRLEVFPAAPLVLTLTALAALLLSLASVGRAQSTDFEPGALGKQRAALYLKAARSPLADLEGEVNHLALVSETCRAQYGTKACGLIDKPLASDKLEERYVYYVRQPVEEHLKGQKVKIARRNWAVQNPPASQ